MYMVLVRKRSLIFSSCLKRQKRNIKFYEIYNNADTLLYAVLQGSILSLFLYNISLEDLILTILLKGDRIL